MVQIKMKYGIDLGTTNSVICKMENGEPIIKKTDVLKDTLPSCVSFSKKKVVKIGDTAMNDLRHDKSCLSKSMVANKSNVFIEFKRTMGLETKYSSSNMGKSYSSEELSAEVLKTLKSFISEDTIEAAVITIPAKFKTDQIAATKRAASLAGIRHCELLQEPIAAAIAYGLSTTKKDGYWLVFDFGGGTFDAALLEVQDGIMQVKDTEGDNYLGGKDLDYAIVDGIIIPHLQQEFSIEQILADDAKREILRDAMKFYAEQVKNQLSFKNTCDITSQLGELGNDDNDTELELDMVISTEQLKPTLAPIFQKAIDITKGLLKRNNLPFSKLDSLILVGGPTHSPILRQMLKDQITLNVDTSIDPMTAVAQGAAIYASGIDSEIKEEIKSGNIALDITFESTTVQPVSYISVKLLPKDSTRDIPDKLYVELVSSDKSWSTGKIEINEIGDVIECQLLEGKANLFTIVAYDGEGNSIPCYPNEITIVQGSKAGNAVLPYHIGIEVRDSELDRDVFLPLKGLEKNQQVPAVGVCNGLKTPKQIRPGINSDRLVIPIYLGEHAAAGTSAIHNDHVFDVEITGDDVPALIPADSDVDIIVKVDRSQLLRLEATFPILGGESIEKEVDIPQRQAPKNEELSTRLNDVQRKLKALSGSKAIQENELSEVKQMLNDVESRFDGEKASEDGRMHLLADLRRMFQKMEKVEKEHEWDAIEAELREEFDRLEKANDELGNEHNAQVDDLRRQTDRVIRSRDVKMGRATLKAIEELFIAVTFVYQLMGVIRQYSQEFNDYSWKDATRARQLLNQGVQIINDNPTVERLNPIVSAIFDLLENPAYGSNILTYGGRK